MEEKMRRESKVYVEKLFKKLDTNGIGAIHKNDMMKLILQVIDNFDDQKEMDELLLQHAKRNKVTIKNPQTKQLEFKYYEDTIDFPSTMAIVVHFLTKNERKSSNAFTGQSLIRFEDLDRRPSVLADANTTQRKRMF